MKYLTLKVGSFLILLFFAYSLPSLGQVCSGVLSNGVNLVSNHDFAQGYANWNHDPLYSKYTPCGTNCWSAPGNVYAGTSQWDFNAAFANFQDHSVSNDNMMLMVDGICQTGVNLWTQSNIPITPNTNYFFSIWVTCLKATAPYGTLRFDINGTQVGPIITADGDSGGGPTVGNWVKYTAVWNSGLTPPSSITISIQNNTTTGCTNSVDFAVDDITFTPGCDFGTPGPVPNLGVDFTICGKTLPYALNPGFNPATQARPDITYTWYKDGVQQTSGMGPSFYSFNITSAGTYSVCVDSAGSCPKTDILTVTADYSIDLGPDLVLCNPTTALLDAVYNGPGVTYQWYFNSNPISGATAKTLSLTNPGNYSVTVTDPICGVQSDDVDITTNAATPVDGTFCPVANGGTGIANLAVSGPGKYKWWNSPTSTNPADVVGTGLTFTTPVLTASTFYYVEDTSTFAITVGPPSIGHGMVDPQGFGPNDNSNLLVFNALTSFKLDSITLFPYNYYCPVPGVTGNDNIANIIILDNMGNTVGTSTFTAKCNGQGTPAPPMKVPVGITIPEGNGYQIKLNTGSTQFAIFLNTTGSGGNPPVPELFPYPSTFSNVVQMVSNSPQNFSVYYKPNAYPGFFDWKITKGINCQRVPVQAIQDCPLCTGAVAPSLVSVDNPSYCVGSVSQITLSATGGSGDALVWYRGSCGGTLVASNLTGANETITAPSVPTTYYARWESPGCNSPCMSVTVTPQNPPTTSNAGSMITLCNTTTTTLAANTPTTGAGAWAVVSGTGTINSTTSPTSGVSNIGAGDLVLSWTITNAPCPASSSQVTIHRDVLAAPVFDLTGQSWDTCANTTGVSYATTIDNSSTNTYQWSTTGTLAITANAANGVTLNVGASGGTLQLTEISASCSLSVSKAITISPAVVTPNAGTDISICSNSVNLAAVAPSVGNGQWSLTNGSGTIGNSSNASTNVTGLGIGQNTFTWTVNGCGGPLTDDVIVNVGASTLLINGQGPTDTSCVGTERQLTTTISGGSGDYNYVWTSDDATFVSPGSMPSISVKNEQTQTAYYVYAMDNLNIGCNSNIDTIYVYAINNQELVIPNLITPNGDTKNDYLEIKGFGGSTLLPGSTVEISNRWGDRIYKHSDYDNSWKAENLSDGLYYYYIKSGCGSKVYKGWLQIVR